jgi:hypothetical protein
MEVRFSAPVQTNSEDHPAFYIVSAGSFLGVKQPGRGVDHPRNLGLRLKKDEIYTSALPLDLHGLF